MSRPIAHAMLCATVEAPTPPLAPTIATIRPTGFASGDENRLQIARTTSIVPMGAISIRSTPRRVQVTIERHVIDAAHHDHSGARIADFGKPVQPAKDVVGSSVSFDQDDIWRGRTIIGFGGRRDTTHLNFDVGLCKASIFACRLDRSRGFDRLAKSLHRELAGPAQYARRLHRQAPALPFFRGLQLAERLLSFSHIADFAEVIADICAGGILTLAIVIDHYRSSRRIGWVFAPRLNQIGWVLDHGREIALRGTANSNTADFPRIRSEATARDHPATARTVPPLPSAANS